MTPRSEIEVVESHGYRACGCGAVMAKGRGPWACGGRGCEAAAVRPRVVVNPALPPDVIEFRDEGRVVGAIVNVKPRAGKAAEDALCAALEAEGFGNIADLPCGFGIDTDRVFVRQYAWALDAGRSYAADFAWPAIKVMAEVVGGAHAAGKSRVRKDVERDGLAAALGWLVVKVTPEQVNNGAAVALIQQALRGA